MMYFEDVFVSGYSEVAKGGKFEGLIGALEVSVYTKEGKAVVVGRCLSGLDTVCKKIFNPDGSLCKEIYGRVLEISFMGWTPKLLMCCTALRRFRFDKNPEECVIDFTEIKKQFQRYK